MAAPRCGGGGGRLPWSISRGWLLWDGLAFVDYYGMDVPGAAGWGCPGGLQGGGDLAGGWGAQPGCGDGMGTKNPTGVADTKSEPLLRKERKKIASPSNQDPKPFMQNNKGIDPQYLPFFFFFLS